MKIRNTVLYAQNSVISFRKYVTRHLGFLNSKPIEFTPAQILEREQSNLAFVHFLRQLDYVFMATFGKLNILNIGNFGIQNIISVLLMLSFVIYFAFV